MDSATQYSAGAVVADTGMEAAIGALDSYWISRFELLTPYNLIKLLSNDFLSLHGINPRTDSSTASQ